MECIEETEGKTRFFVPVQDPDTAFPPGTAPVFFNRRMEMNRDITVLLTSVISPGSYLDAMGATGVRGLRIANECGVPVTINDKNPRAADLVRHNVSLAGQQIEVTCEDVNVLLSGRRFDCVDLDPFGTPTPFIDSAIRGTHRYLMVTATDTAPLCGAHKKAGIRRYFAEALNNEYHAETGLRILMACIVRETVKYDRGIEPLFCFSHEHFVRLHFRLSYGAHRADNALKHIGYILQCPSCPYRHEVHGILPSSSSCPDCGRQLTPVGPLWLGKIQDDSIIDRMLAAMPQHTLGTAGDIEKLLLMCKDELPIAGFYDYHQLAKMQKTSPPPIGRLLESLRKMGFTASRCHYCGTGIKTDALPGEIMTAIRELQSEIMTTAER